MCIDQVLNFGTHGVERDHAAALSYFRMAAAAGDAEAMAHLGSMCANGYGRGLAGYGVTKQGLGTVTGA